MTDLLRQFDHDLRVAVTHPGMRKDTLPGLVRLVRPAPGMSFITATDLPNEELDQAIEEQISYFAEHGQRFSWKVYSHDQADRLVERLQAHGFSADPPEPVMVLDLQNAPAALRAPLTADVRRISDVAEIDHVIAVEEGVWSGDFDWLRQRMATYLAVESYVSVFVAYMDGKPASAGWIFYQNGGRFASLFGGSTLAEHRGRGLYTALLAARAQEAIGRGYRSMLIEPSDMSMPIVRKYGFQVLTNVQDYEQE